MRQIVCFGDSNTFGFCPHPEKERYERQERWTGILAELLGEDYRVEEEGYNGRTTDMDDPREDGRNGRAALEELLVKYPAPDLMVMMLGTNDLKVFFHRRTEEIAEAAGRLVARMQEVYPNTTKILLVAPVLVAEGMVNGPFEDQFGDTAARRSEDFAETYEKQAKKYGVHYWNAALHAKVSDADYLHLDYEDHKTFAKGIYQKIQEIFA